MRARDASENQNVQRQNEEILRHMQPAEPPHAVPLVDDRERQFALDLQPGDQRDIAIAVAAGERCAEAKIERQAGGRRAQQCDAGWIGKLFDAIAGLLQHIADVVEGENLKIVFGSHLFLAFCCGYRGSALRRQHEL
jgi:hypothetical protein